MAHFLVFFLSLTGLGFIEALSAAETPNTKYQTALELIHSYSGSGDELDRAAAIADGLSRSHPGSGLSQTLNAEALSTWELGQDGKPEALRAHILELADRALILNPKLAQAHVAKARAYARASLFREANTEVDTALSLDSGLAGAMFVKADIYRKLGDLQNGEIWYGKFISATPSVSRKSNGYYWLGKMFYDETYRNFSNPLKREWLNKKAGDAYKKMMDLHEGGAWRQVNYAIFLNGQVADFDGAEKYAQKSLSLMEFPMARYHLAAARFQRLNAISKNLDVKFLKSEISKIELSNRVSLDEAIEFDSFSGLVRSRLRELRSRTYAP